jgi:methyl-accepting chemotaxis protein
MASDRNNRKIKNLLINFAVQNRIIVVNLLFMMLVLLLTMAIIYTHLYEMEVSTEGVWNFPLGELTMSFSLKLIILYSLLFITFLFSIVTQLWMTHRVCGPLVNFCNVYKKIARGDFFKRVHLRKEDLLQKEADQFNEMVERISELVNELKTENELLNSAVEEAARKK